MVVGGTEKALHADLHVGDAAAVAADELAAHGIGRYQLG